MKVLFCLTYYYPHWTGLTKYCQILAENLAKKGHQVTVLTSRYTKELKSQERINKVSVNRVSIIGHLSRSVLMPSYVFNFIKQLKETEVVSIFIPMLEALPLVVLAKILRKKVIITHNGDLVLPKSFLNQILEFIYFWTTYLAIKLADKIVLYTEDYALHSKLLLKVREKWLVIKPPISIPVPISSGIDKLKKKYHLENNKIVGFSGRFVEEKGVDYLIKSIPYVLEEFPKTKFVFAGEYKIFYENFYGKLTEEIESNKKSLIFLGLIKDQQELADFYGLVDLTVIPSRTDCFPLSQIESMMCETPAVVTNIPGARMGVKMTGSGLIVEPRKPEQIAQGIIKILKNPKKYFKKRNEIENFFSLKKTIDDYKKLFNG